MKEPLDILKEFWKYDQFRSPQDEIIDASLNNQDVLALLPTGAGKSICYQVPALARTGVCLVISPLIALMKDQVQQLEKRGVNASAIYTGLKEPEIDRILNNCASGHTQLLYISPERLASKRFLIGLKTLHVSMLAIDEAHCISQWGFDFRPSYRNIASIRELFPTIPIIALTASATPKVQEDINQSLQLKKDVKIFKSSFERSNISFVVRHNTSKPEKMLEILNKVNGSSIIYTSNRKRTQEIAEFLIKNGISATFYHAGLSSDERSKRQEAWIKNQCRVMCCTNAFGMGIDKPNVRMVIHADVPESLEAYYQEAGRAGRDGKRSYAVLLFNEKDKEKLLKSVDEKFPDFEFVKLLYNALYNYLNIAFAGGKGHSFEFNISDFGRRYKWDTLKVFNSLKLLEQAGYLTLGEAFYLPSRLKFNFERTDLYRFQVENIQYDGFIKTILRTYENVQNDFVKINELHLAKRAGITTSECIFMLKELNAKGVLLYIPSSEKPRISFLEERLREDYIRLDFDWIAFIKKQMKSRIQAMFDYAEADDSTCRQVVMRRYFGETKTGNCGTCDHCLLMKQLELVQSEDFRNHLINQIKKSGSTGINYQDFTKNLESSIKEYYLEMIRILIDEKQLEWVDESKNEIRYTQKDSLHGH
jgi:ATP-dependent DNA helicase RecQ